MIESAIRMLLGGFSVVMLAAAFVVAAFKSFVKPEKTGAGFIEQLFCWTLLLSVGAQGIYTFIVHVFFAEYSARHIGWAVSPFQYEVGIADLTVGVLGVIAFWSDFSFQAAAAIAAIVWYGGDAVGHVRQMVVAHNFEPGNAGPWFWTDVLVPIVLALCLVIIMRRRKVAS